MSSKETKERRNATEGVTLTTDEWIETLNSPAGKTVNNKKGLKEFREYMKTEKE